MEKVIKLSERSGSSMHVSPDDLLQACLDARQQGGPDGCETIIKKAKKMLIIALDDSDGQFNLAWQNAGMKASECVVVAEAAKQTFLSALGFNDMDMNQRFQPTPKEKDMAKRCDEVAETNDLKHYQCHKKVHAKPMTRGEFQAWKHNSPSEQPVIDDPEPGYLVIYSMNTPDEYESWSPKQAFEEGYTEIIGEA